MHNSIHDCRRKCVEEHTDILHHITNTIVILSLVTFHPIVSRNINNAKRIRLSQSGTLRAILAFSIAYSMTSELTEALLVMAACLILNAILAYA